MHKPIDNGHPCLAKMSIVVVGLPTLTLGGRGLF